MHFSRYLILWFCQFQQRKPVEFWNLLNIWIHGSSEPTKPMKIKQTNSIMRLKGLKNDSQNMVWLVQYNTVFDLQSTTTTSYADPGGGCLSWEKFGWLYRESLKHDWSGPPLGKVLDPPLHILTLNCTICNNVPETTNTSN